MMIATMPAAAGFIRSGQIRALAVSGSKRSPAFPELPTIAEAGVPGYAYDTWYAVLGPAPMQPALVNWLNGQINTVANAPDMKERLAKSGLEVDTGTPARLQSLLASEIVRWGKAITEAGIKVQYSYVRPGRSDTGQAPAGAAPRHPGSPGHRRRHAAAWPGLTESHAGEWQ
jgi:tripartite-type tricarboxylate transporter receptor subunit TctC